MLSKRILRECWMSLAKCVRAAFAVVIIVVAIVWLIMFPKTRDILRPDFVISVALGVGLIVSGLLILFMTRSRAVPIVLLILLLWSVLCNICLCAVVRGLHQLSLGLLEAERLSARRNLRMLESGEEGSIERLAELLRRVAGQEYENHPASDDSTEKKVGAAHYTPFDQEVAGLAGVELSIAVSTEDNGPVLVFIAKNNTNKEFVTTELREGHNRIAIFLPGGRHAGDDSEWHNKAARVVIAPSESKQWRLDAHQLLKYFKEQGLYRIRWKVGRLESQDLFLLKEE